MKEAAAKITAAFSDVKEKLFLSGSVYGASISTAATAYAIISVDNVLAVTLGDAAGRASVSASAARNALIGNLISHLEKPPKNYFHLYFSISFEKIKYIFKKNTKKPKKRVIRYRFSPSCRVFRCEAP